MGLVCGLVRRAPDYSGPARTKRKKNILQFLLFIALGSVLKSGDSLYAPRRNGIHREVTST